MAPGLTGLATDMMIKALPEEAINLLTEAIQEYWMNPKCDFETWHVQKLVTLYKGKGDAKDLNNWGGICLKETTMKIVSTIIADRLLIQLHNIGTNTQSGHVGCQEALHVLRTTLTIC